MATATLRLPPVAVTLAVLLLLLVIAPSAVSLTNGRGAVCFSNASCPLSALNPCVRTPSFAVVGRCAADIR